MSTEERPIVLASTGSHLWVALRHDSTPVVLVSHDPSRQDQPAQVASATSAFMIFFTSGANLVTYLAQGVLTPDPGYVVWIVTLGFCSAMVGRLSSVFITTRLRHPSFIVLTLGAILLVSMFLLIARVAQVEPQWAFSALCPTD